MANEIRQVKDKLTRSHKIEIEVFYSDHFETNLIHN